MSGRIWLAALALVVTLAAGCSHADSKAPRAAKPTLPAEKLGPGYFVSQPPAGALCAIDSAGHRVKPSVTSDFSGPPTSNRWWSSLMFKYDPKNRHSFALHAHPLVLRARAAGLGVGYPDTPTVTPRAYMHEFSEDLLIGLAGLDAAETRVASYSDWMVTADWQDRLRLSFGHGLPFVYGERRDASAVVIRISKEMQNNWTIFAENKEAVGVRVGRHHYGLFAPLGGRWLKNDAELSLEAGTSRHFSLAVLPDGQPETLELFRAHAYAAVRATRVSWKFDEKTSTVSSDFAVESDFVAECTGNACAGLSRQPLLALYRHQWLNAGTQAYLPGTYDSPRGKMKLLAADHFEMQAKLTGILPILPGVPGHEKSRITNHVRAVLDEPELFPLGLGEKPDHDAYWEGKSFGKLSNLVQLTDQLGETELRDRLLSAIERRLEDWFDGQQPRLFYYDAEWRSFMGFPDSYGSATQINDHHFHYGYFVMAAATVARFDPAWADAWAPFVERLIRDAANWSRADESAPFLRHMDAYAGHSWANGPAQFEEGNNEEASSEELNFSSASLLWGTLRHDREIQALGAFLVTQQVAAVEQYWFDVDNQVFPADFEHPVVAMVWGAGGKYDTWFDQDPTVIHGINFLPFTGASLYLGRKPEFVRKNFDVLLGRSHGEITTWRDYVLMYLATADAKLAREHFERDPHFLPEFGNSMAFTLHWLQAWEELGHLDTTTTADVATAAVFVQGNKRSYSAFNPDPTARTVTFSDGKTLRVPARSLAWR